MSFLKRFCDSDTKCFSQITPRDVESQIRVCFRDSNKNLNKGNVSMIAQYIKSRGKEINYLQCFIFLQNHCRNVVDQLTRDLIRSLMDCMCRKVYECLTGLMLPRPMKGGRHSKKWDDPKIQDLHYYDKNMKLIGIRRATQGQQKYPLKSIHDFWDYEVEMYESLPLELMTLNNMFLYDLYIDSHYVLGNYTCINAIERFKCNRPAIDQESVPEVQDSINLSSITFDPEGSNNKTASNDTNLNSVSGIKCVVTKKKTSIEVISSKTVSRSQERNNEGHIVQVLRHVMNVKRRHVEHEVTERYSSTKKM